VSPVLCKLCTVEGNTIFANALAGDDELYEHIEMVHDVPVRREGETDQKAMARVRAKNPRMGGPDCRCVDCKRAWWLGW
jgi:hypothetical protein